MCIVYSRGIYRYTVAFLQYFTVKFAAIFYVFFFLLVLVEETPPPLCKALWVPRKRMINYYYMLLIQQTPDASQASSVRIQHASVSKKSPFVQRRGGDWTLFTSRRR